MNKYQADLEVDAPKDFAFAWHERPGAFERLVPAWETIEVLERPASLRDGERLVFRLRKGPLWIKWVAQHDGYEKGVRFCDRQVKGPFAHWVHEHRFIERGPEQCTLQDNVKYRAPFAKLLGLAPGTPIENRVAATFAYRHAVLKRDIEAHYRAKLAPMRILISGSTGLVGTALQPFLQTGGHTPVPLVRKTKPKGDAISWNPKEGFAPDQAARLEEIDAVVHLAGEPVFGFWTDEKKKRIRESRVVGTRKLSEALARLQKKPKVLICASAIGFYGSRGDEVLDESSPAGDSFFAEVGREWEEATKPAADAGIRVVNLRFGIIMSPQGGALKTMLIPFSLGLGGRLGKGQHYVGWISLDDVLGVILHALAKDDLSGPLNVTGPKPVTNEELTYTLAKVLRRPVAPHLPAFLIRSVNREMADEMLLASIRAVPKRLQESGYQFMHGTLREALRHLLGKAGVRG